MGNLQNIFVKSINYIFNSYGLYPESVIGGLHKFMYYVPYSLKIMLTFSISSDSYLVKWTDNIRSL